MKKSHCCVLSDLKLLISLGVFLLPLFCFGAVRYVPSEYSTIQGAINAASDGDEIIVSAGTYYENINFNGKNIILRSTDPTNSSVVASTIIDGNQAGSVVTFSVTELTTCVLSGFTITKGRACWGGGIWGGGIYGNGTRATIKNNYIRENRAYGGRNCGNGGGLHNCDGMIENNIISGNSAYGYYCEQWSIGYFYFTEESTFGRGGGLYGCDGTIQNNIIYDNSSADSGGALSWCHGIIQNNTIYGNKVSGGVTTLISCRPWGCSTNVWYSGWGGGLSLCSAIVRNCIIWQNEAKISDDAYDNWTTPLYSWVQGISSDPQFVDANGGNFHLLPSSPCIDSGCYIDGLTEDFEGDRRPINGSLESRGDGSDYDIGADEFRGPLASKSYDFELTNEGWGAVTVSGFTPPYFYYMPGQIKLAAQNNTNTYGYWTSEADAVPVIADCLYRASWTVATDVTDPLAVPQMRLRVNSQNLQQADMLVVSSCGDGSYAPIPQGWTTYEMYFVPPESALGKPEDQDDLILSFDMLNFDPSDAADGSLLLDRVVVDAISLSTLETPTLLKVWTFDTDTEGWQLGGAPIFTAPLSDSSGGALWLIAQDNTNTFGFWSSPSEEVQVEANKLYRIQFDVSSDVIDRDAVPCLRLGVHSEDFQASIVKVISSVTGAEMSPTLEGRTYDLYFYPPQSLVGTDADSILVAFDILNFDPSDAQTGALMLNSVFVESFNSVP